MFVGMLRVMRVSCWRGSHSWRDFWYSGLVASIRRMILLVGSLAMSTEALRQPSLVFAVMFRARGRFVSPTMAL